MPQGLFCSEHVRLGVLNLCSSWARHACTSESFDSDLTNSMFSFIIYSITVSLTLVLHPLPYSLLSLPYPYPAFPVGQGPG